MNLILQFTGQELMMLENVVRLSGMSENEYYCDRLNGAYFGELDNNDWSLLKVDSSLARYEIVVTMTKEERWRWDTAAKNKRLKLKEWARLRLLECATNDWKNPEQAPFRLIYQSEHGREHLLLKFAGPETGPLIRFDVATWKSLDAQSRNEKLSLEEWIIKHLKKNTHEKGN